MPGRVPPAEGSLRYTVGMAGPESITRTDISLAASLALLAMLCAWLVMAPGVCGLFHDDGIYVCTAKALAEGNGYRLIHLPGAPAQTKYPILWPAILAPLWAAAPYPTNVVLMQCLSLLCAGALSASAYLYLVRWGYAGRGAAFGAGVIAATSATFAFYGGAVLTEMPFGLACVAALWMLEAALREEPPWWKQALLGVTLALPFLLRGAGAPFLPAGLALLWWHGRPLRWAAAAAAFAVLPWALWVVPSLGAWGRDPAQGYYTDYLGWWGEGAGLLRIIQHNAIYATGGAFGQALDGADSSTKWMGLKTPWLYGQLLLGAVVWVEAARLLANGRALAWMLAAYLALVLAWPWPSGRFMTPLWPILIALALRRLGEVIPSAWAGVVLVALLVALNGVHLGRQAVLNRATGMPNALDDPEPASREAYREVFDWLRANTAPEDVIGCVLDPVVYLETGRLSFRPFIQRPPAKFYDQPARPPDPAELDRLLTANKARWLVDLPESRFNGEKDLHPEIAALDGKRLRLVFRGNIDPRMAIYEILP